MPTPSSSSSWRKVQAVDIREGPFSLPGDLTIPSPCLGVVIFAHGSGSSRLSPRNRKVAQYLNEKNLGTLLFDLLTLDEAENRENVFDIQLLAERLIFATRWLNHQEIAKNLPIGYFGASTGAAAALSAAASLQKNILAVVSRGGRPDLAIPKLKNVTAPTLLIVGGDDETVIEMNQEALPYLKSGKIVLVPGATHLFEEPGTLEAVSELASQWFTKHLQSRITSNYKKAG